MEEKLQDIWNKDYLKDLFPILKERGYNYSINTMQKDILITGINPSFRQDAIDGNCNFELEVIMENSNYDPYWSSLLKIVYDDKFDFRSETAYLDIFYFRETDQNYLKREILKSAEGINFLVDQLTITQNVIEEVIKPKLIIVKNKESWAYWGKLASQGIIWMGYDLEKIGDYESGELYKIKGFVESNERINSERAKTNLENTLVFFTSHFQYVAKSKRPDPALVSELMEITRTF